MIEQVVVVYNAVNEFAGSDQKIEYTAGSFYIPIIDFVTSGETSDGVLREKGLKYDTNFLYKRNISSKIRHILF